MIIFIYISGTFDKKEARMTTLRVLNHVITENPDDIVIRKPNKI